MPNERAPITFLFTVKNEQVNLPYSLASVRDWASEVFVLDSGSTDKTREISEEYGAKFFYHEWLGYAGQKNWALDNLPITSPWVFIIDADEVITPKLRDELIRVSTDLNCSENAFYVNRYFVFLGRRIGHCGYYPSWNIRFFRKGKARYEQRQVHEHMVAEGKVGFLKHDMEHYDRRGMFHYIAKHNEYSSLEATEMYKLMTGRSDTDRGALMGSPAQRRKWIKTYVWPKLPARWFWRWFYMYILRMGFLDGIVGFHFCVFLASYEHHVSLKLKELVQNDREQQSKVGSA
ncbi:MAG TPA: glycosyltransferase family 2 protein [Tepidisphaeraceae bacterium]|nr:glycosyltransferase family 2 protein [Tepidisphaeraceae bacterium]